MVYGGLDAGSVYTARSAPSRPHHDVGILRVRHTYSTLLSECGNDTKVVQELMRQASSRPRWRSIRIRSRGSLRRQRSRETQSQVVDVLFSRKRAEAAACGHKVLWYFVPLCVPFWGT